MSAEPQSVCPLWLEFSGLPRMLSAKVRGGSGWPVFKKLVELDLAGNLIPDTVEITLEELEWRCGVGAGAARKAILSLRKLKLVTCFLPETDEEQALIRIRVPLETPEGMSEIVAKWPALFPNDPRAFRYSAPWAEVEARKQAEPNPRVDPVLQEVVDLYFNTVGLKMNAFILDELKLIRERYPLDALRRQFRRAQQNEIHSLSWVVKELVRSRQKNAQEKRP